MAFPTWAGLCMGIFLAATAGSPAFAGENPRPEMDPRLFGPGLDDAVVGDLERQCRKGTVDFPGLVARYRAAPSSSAFVALTSTISAPNLYPQYVACVASVPGSKLDCASLKVGTQDRGSWMWGQHQYCVEFKAFAVLAYASLRGGNAGAACASWISVITDKPPKDKPSLDRACGAVVKFFKTGDRTQARLACDEAARWGIPKEQCLAGHVFVGPRPQACSALPDPVERRICADEAAFLLAARSPEGCAGLPSCKALSAGDAAACEPLLARHSKVWCGEAVKPLGAQAAAQKEAARRYAEKVKAEAAAEAERKAKALQDALAEAKRKGERELQDFYKKQKAEGEALKRKAAEEQVRLAQEAAAKKREEDEKIQRAIQDRVRKRQFRPGQQMQDIPPEVIKQQKAAQQGKLKPAQKLTPNAEGGQ